MNVNPNMQGLINVLSKKLGMTPEELASDVKEGKFDNAMKSMNQNQAMMFQQAMQNPKMVEQIMSSPQAQSLYKKLTGEK